MGDLVLSMMKWSGFGWHLNDFSARMRWIRLSECVEIIVNLGIPTSLYHNPHVHDLITPCADSHSIWNQNAITVICSTAAIFIFYKKPLWLGQVTDREIARKSYAYESIKHMHKSAQIYQSLLTLIAVFRQKLTASPQVPIWECFT